MKSNIIKGRGNNGGSFSRLKSNVCMKRNFNILNLNLLNLLYQSLKDVIWRKVLDIEVKTKDCRYHVHVLDASFEDFLKFTRTIILIPKTHYCLVDQVKNTLTQKYHSHDQIGFIQREGKE